MRRQASNGLPWAGDRRALMQIEILAIGRARAGPERALYQSYADRIRWPLTLRELDEKRRLPPAELKAREGALLLDALPRDAAGRPSLSSSAAPTD